MKTRYVLALIAIAPAAIAHHGLSPHYDANQSVTIEGTITDFKFVNPHAVLYIDVTNDDGTVSNWNCEMSASSHLRRLGWTKDLFSPGRKIEINGIAARRDPHGCSFRTGELEGGFRISRNDPLNQDTATANLGNGGVDIDDPGSFAGTWQTQRRQRNRGPGQAGGPGQGPRQEGLGRLQNSLTGEGRKAADAYDMRFDDPALECSPSSIIRAWSEPNGISEIELAEDRIIIRHEFMDTVRTVHLDARTHPATVERSLTGHSVGWFEDSELVIETTGFNAGVLIPHPGVVHTENMRVIERVSLSAGGSQLIREYEVTDPEYLSEPITGSNTWIRTDIALPVYDCTELTGVSKIRPESND